MKKEKKGKPRSKVGGVSGRRGPIVRKRKKGGKGDSIVIKNDKCPRGHILESKPRIGGRDWEPSD